MSDPSIIDTGEKSALLILMQAQQQQLHRLSTQMQQLNGTVNNIDKRLAIIESRDYNADIKEMKQHLDAIQKYIDGQTGVANFFSWISKNIVWMIMIVAAIFASFGAANWEMRNGN